MELIKQIKGAETQAKSSVRNARQIAVENSEKARKEHAAAMDEAKTKRHDAIEAAVGQAEQEGQKEVEVIHLKASQQREELRDKVSPKIDAQAARIVDFIKG